MAPIIRQGRYIDSRDGEVKVLTGWDAHTITFNGNIVVVEADFYKYFRLVNHDN